MTLMRYTPSTNKRKSNQIKINRLDMMFIALLLAVMVYLLVAEPFLLTIFGCSSIVGLGLYNINRAVPVLEKWFGIRIQFWHVAVAIIGITSLFTLFGAPAHAVFLDDLETFVSDLVTDSGTGIDDTTVALFFNMIRAIFLLLVVAAGLFAYNQAQQGNDWRPIATQIAIAFAIVIAIDILTLIFAGTTTTP